jgi:hypothetical protein
MLTLAPVFAQAADESAQAERKPRQDAVSTTVQKAAAAFDSFFSTEEYDWRENKTRIRLRGNALWVDEHGTDFGAQLKLKLVLPGLSDRFQVIANDEGEDELGSGLDEPDDVDLALRFVPDALGKLRASFDVGLSTRGDPNLQGFGRVNLVRGFGLGDSRWLTYVQNRLYWYTDTGWRNDFRWYFERPISDNLLFRSRTRFDYQEDKDENWLPEQRFTLYQQINDRTALAYEALAQRIFFEDSVFDEDEFLDDCKKCYQYQLRLRFRRNLKNYPRIFYELWPIAAWSEQRDYEFTPAALFRLEVIFGDLPRGAATLN